MCFTKMCLLSTSVEATVRWIPKIITIKICRILEQDEDFSSIDRWYVKIIFYMSLNIKSKSSFKYIMLIFTDDFGAPPKKPLII